MPCGDPATTRTPCSPGSIPRSMRPRRRGGTRSRWPPRRLSQQLHGTRATGCLYISRMSLQSLWNDLAALVAQVPDYLILALTVLAVAAGASGPILRRSVPAAGALLRAGSTFGLAGILVLVVLQIPHFDARCEMDIPEMALYEKQV